MMALTAGSGTFILKDIDELPLIPSNCKPPSRGWSLYRAAGLNRTCVENSISIVDVVRSEHSAPKWTGGLAQLQKTNCR